MGKTIRCVSSDCGMPRGSLCIHTITSIGISLGGVCHRNRVFKVPCSRKALSVLQGQRGRLLVHWRESGLMLGGEARPWTLIIGCKPQSSNWMPHRIQPPFPVQKYCGASSLRSKAHFREHQQPRHSCTFQAYVLHALKDLQPVKDASRRCPA